MNVSNQQLIQDTVEALKVQLSAFSSIVCVDVENKNNWYNFQLTTNKEFLSDDEHDKIFETVIDSNLDLRLKIDQKIYFKHTFIGVEKFFFENTEFDTWEEAYEAAAKRLTEKPLDQLIQVREF